MELFDGPLQQLRQLVAPTAGSFVLLRPRVSAFLQNADAIDVLVFVILALLCIVGVLGAGRVNDAENNPGPEFVFQPNKENKAVVSSIKDRVGDYVPPNWWYNAHIGSMVPLGCDLPIKYDRQVLEQESTMDWYPRRPPLTTSVSQELRVVLVFPGLGLSSSSKSIKKFVHTLVGDDEDVYTAVVLTRGVGTELRPDAKLWHPAMTDDGEQVIRHINQSHGPRAKLFLCGFSAGTNIVKTLLCAPERTSFPVQGAMCIACNNTDYRIARDILERSVIGNIYSRLMCGIYRDIALSSATVREALGEERLSTLRGLSLLSEYDEFSLQHLHGHVFETREDYYAALSGGGSFRCDVPLLQIQPADDPLHQGRVKEHLKPEELTAKCTRTVYMQTKFGNHFGFYEESIFKAFSSKKTYTYPARVARVFFDTIDRESTK